MDSDSDADASFTATNVLLGYAEAAPTDDAISHLGGVPTWLDAAPAAAADARLAKCLNCNRLMPLLLQLNGAVPESPHERWLYVFACREKGCRRRKGVARALRGVKVAAGASADKPEAQKKKQKEKAAGDSKAGAGTASANLGSTLFGGSSPSGTANPFSDPTRTAPSANPFAPSATSPSSSSSSTNPFAPANPFAAAKPSAPSAPSGAVPSLSKSFADTLKLSSSNDAPKSSPSSSRSAEPEPLLYGPPEPWPAPESYAQKYPSFYLDAEYEELDATPGGGGGGGGVGAENVKVLEEDGNGGDAPMSAAGFESTMDKTFQKFADRVAQNPEQVLRYEHHGTPLLYSTTDAVGPLFHDDQSAHAPRSTPSVPACANCGRRRAFEFQLMPHAITMLERDEPGVDGMEWGSIVVATCTCVPNRLEAATDGARVGYVEEWCGVQWEVVG